jgi:hypothetical protein
MQSLKAFFPVLTVVAAALTWLLLSEPGARILSSWLQPWRPQGPQVGKVLQLEGSMKTVRDGRVESFEGSLNQPLAVHSGDRIEIDAKSRAVLVLNSQDELNLTPFTAAALQLWNERDPNSAVYLTLLSGEAELRKSGVKGKAYIVRDGRLYLPGQNAGNKALALTVLRNAPHDMQLGEETDSPPTDTAAETTASAGLETETPAAFGAEPETLSNEYIDETITTRQGLLQKCWLARVRENPSAKVKMTVQFEISRRGKVREVRVSDSSVEDDTLKNCVSQVFERLNFRSFKGSEIALSYPIQFE